jgi:hypothetical protein
MSVGIEANVFSDAIRHFWAVRERQSGDQKQRGGVDQGSRGAVTGGQHMDGFIQKITDLMVSTGVPQSDIHVRVGVTTLPGYFRPTKKWDLVIVVNGVLLAALELKSQVGPSFGNNFNNRTEEAMGSALDIWTAYREGAFRAAPQPWLGYVFVLEDCPASRTPVKVEEPHLPVFPEFKRASYAERYQLFCRRLVLERHYSGACFLLSQRYRTLEEGNYTEPDLDLSAPIFLTQLLRHVAQS